MATIALYAGKMNQMPSLIGEVKKSVDDYSSELFSLKSKALNIRKSVCDLDDVIGMVQTSTQIQEKKIESLENFSQKTEEFMAEVVRIDEEAAAVINQKKEDFYNKYNYLKPDAEKNFLEICFDSAAEWCKEHWKEIVTTVGIIIGAALAIAAVAATGGAALIPLLTALGVAAGTAANISLAVAVIAVVSTIGAAALNIADTWGNIDNPTFNTLQSVFNWTSTISNGVYALGLGHNKKIQGKGGPPKFINKSGGSTNDVYDGVKQASEYLKKQGVPRQYRKQILESFDVRTIKLEIAGENTYGLRFYGGNANAEGRYLFETFSPLTNRSNLALTYEWNSMTKIQQFQVKSGTTMITGAVASQTSFGAQYIGGAIQWFINNLEDLIRCQ